MTTLLPVACRTNFRPVTLLAVLLLLQACGKNHNQPTAVSDIGKPYTLPAGPAANASYDVSSKGIYKGVTINAQDSSASFQINIANNGQTINCLQYMDSVLRDSMVRYKIDPQAGLLLFPLQRDSSAIPASGRFIAIFDSYRPYDWGNAWVGFNVMSDGSSPLMNVNLNSNQTLDAVLKETSNKQVYCFEGTYEGTYINPSNPSARDFGRVAFAIRSDTGIVILASQASPQFFPASGATVSNGQFTIPIVDGPGGADFVLTGSISGDTCSGTWIRENSTATGTFTAHRTL